jgi:signal transduction histidine kinase
MRRRGMNKLKWRIARDLHDDVGSNLGSISLAADELELANTDAKEEIATISLLAREACAALREVVWVIDESTIRLPQLIQKLVDRAERVLDGVKLLVEVPSDCPDCMVSLIFKRHLFSFFKEAVHNCARHSQATQAYITIAVVDQCLQISLRDNGCGFDLADESGGWGLDSMKDRAKEMAAELELISQPGEGTTVRLTVSLKSLLSETDNLYKTSN